MSFLIIFLMLYAFILFFEKVVDDNSFFYSISIGPQTNLYLEFWVCSNYFVFLIENIWVVEGFVFFPTQLYHLKKLSVTSLFLINLCLGFNNEHFAPLEVTFSFVWSNVLVKPLIFNVSISFKQRSSKSKWSWKFMIPEAHAFEE